MRKINLENYTVVIPTTEGEKEIPYVVRKSIEGVLLATGEPTQQRLSMADLLRNARIAQKITSSKDGSVLLEENEFQIVKASFDNFRGFGINDVELCNRIENAEVVEVQEKEL